MKRCEFIATFQIQFLCCIIEIYIQYQHQKRSIPYKLLRKNQEIVDV